jgi:hypothetical protein
MKRYLAINFLLLMALLSFGQTKRIDLDEIKSIVQTDAYKKLFDRFLNNDTTLSLNEYRIIYYGHAFTQNYRPNSRHDSISVLNKYLNSRNPIDFKKVLNYTQQILREFPFNIEQIFINGIAYNQLGQKDTSKLWFYKYDKLIKTIFSTGDGRSEKTAMIVTKITDEYSVINSLRLHFKGQELITKGNKAYDRMKVDQNDLGLDALYFDISLFYYKFD